MAKSGPWAVYVRSFDGYDHIWKYESGPYHSKESANTRADNLRRQCKEVSVRKF